jgi:hypothetical protein
MTGHVPFILSKKAMKVRRGSLDAAQLERAKQLRSQGLTIPVIALRFGVSEQLLQRALRRLELSLRQKSN